MFFFLLSLLLKIAVGLPLPASDFDRQKQVFVGSGSFDKTPERRPSSYG